jgi:tRNA G37 N-methylase TrmD
LLDEWGGGEISKRDLIEIIERKIEEVVKKKQQLESIETYLLKVPHTYASNPQAD